MRAPALAASLGAPVAERPIPRLLRLVGARWRDSDRSFRMRWGELSFGRSGWSLGLNLVGDRPHFSLHVHAWSLLNVYIHLPFLRRFAYQPAEMMDSWGVSYMAGEGALFLRWGPRCKILTVPWHNWRHIAHEVMDANGRSEAGEEQGFAPTDHCVKWGCEKATLVKRGKFWCCPKCGSSYGENPCRKMK